MGYMTEIEKNSLSMWANWRYDLPASVVVMLVALPLCLGVALASGAPLFSGLVAGVVGGVVVGMLSKSPLSVSGPAAGLTVIVLDAIHQLGSFPAFLLAVCLAGAMQVVLGIARAGVIGDFIPSSVIKGMLAAIGIILILKQLPHAVGYDGDYEGSETFWQPDGQNTFSSLWVMFQQHFMLGAIVISTVSLAFLFWWDKRQPKFSGWLRLVPGPLIVVAFGAGMNALFHAFFPAMAIGAQGLVAVPMANSFDAFLGQFVRPDFSRIGEQAIWITALTIALVASIETLLSIEAIDKLDPYKRVTPTSRELLAQGAGNMISGFLGGLPVTSVIVRSSANATSGARTRLSTITHGVLLMVCVVALPNLLNYVPLAALAAVLIAVGYKLTKPAIYLEKLGKGWGHFVPFIITIAAILLSDLLIGIGVGVVVGLVYVLLQNFRSAILLIADGSNYLVRAKKDLFFIHKYELKKVLDNIPANSSLLLDLSRAHFIDLDNVEIINDFVIGAAFKQIKVTVKNNVDAQVNKQIESIHEAA